MSARSITNPADNSALVSSVVRNELQLIENEVASASSIDPGHLHTPAGVSATGTPSATTFWRGDNTWSTPTAGTGDVVGPSSATDNAVARFDTTTGKLIQNSAVTIADTSGNMAGVGTINTLTLPASAFVGLTDAQTLTNKVLTSPTLTTPVINGTPTGTGVSATPTANIIPLFDANKNLSANDVINGFTTTATAGTTTTLTIASTGLQQFTGSTTQTVKLPTTGVVAGQQYTILNSSSGLVTVQSSGANTIYTQASGVSVIYTALIATPTTSGNWYATPVSVYATQGKLGFFNNSLSLSGTDATTMTFPSTSATIARTDAAQTFTGTQTVSLVNTTPQTLTVTSNAATADINHGIQNFTNSSAAAMTITLTTTSAVDGQWKEIRIYDFSAGAEGITWVNTENSTVTAPATSNGSTTLPLSVLFQFNGATSKWRCLTFA